MIRSPISLSLILVGLAACAGPITPAPTPQPTPPAAADNPDAAGDPAEETVEAFDDGLFACRKATGTQTVSFHPGTTLRDLVTWATSFTCKNIVFRHDAGCAKVDVIAPRPMTPRESWALFVSSVEALGLKVVERGDNVAVVGTPAGVSCLAVADLPAERPPSDDDDDDSDTETPDPGAAERAETQRILDAGIVKKNDTTYFIDRALINRVLQSPARFARGARIVPSIKNGKSNGFKLYAIRPGSIYAKLGLKNGDTLHAVNGLQLTTPDKALEAYSKFKTASKLQLSVTRRGKPVTLDYTIR